MSGPKQFPRRLDLRWQGIAVILLGVFIGGLGWLLSAVDATSKGQKAAWILVGLGASTVLAGVVARRWGGRVRLDPGKRVLDIAGDEIDFDHIAGFAVTGMATYFDFGSTAATSVSYDVKVYEMEGISSGETKTRLAMAMERNLPNLVLRCRHHSQATEIAAELAELVGVAWRDETGE